MRSDGWGLGLASAQAAVIEHGSAIHLQSQESVGTALEPEPGGPAQLLVPHLYFWKSANWVRALRLTAEDSRGFWGRCGHHMYVGPGTGSSAALRQGSVSYGGGAEGRRSCAAIVTRSARESA